MAPEKAKYFSEVWHGMKPFSWKNFLLRLYLKTAFVPVLSREQAIREQHKILQKTVAQLSTTQLGRDLHLNKVKDYESFRAKIPVTQYSFYEKYITQIAAGAQHVMTNYPVKWLAKSAGTTSGKSKLIPITRQMMRQCHVRGSFFALARVHQYNKQLRLLSHKSLLLPGGIYETLPSGIVIGDISGILVHNIPWLYRSFYTPSVDVQTHPAWETKIDRTVAQIMGEDVGTMSGVPTWILSVLQRMKAEHPFQKLTEVWKNFSLYFHGGVNFEPYRKQFEELGGKEEWCFYEIYNATEGFFGIQESADSSDLLLLTNNLIFYEFIRVEPWRSGNTSALSLAEVVVGVPYVLLLTAPNGLLRYVLGDVLTFQSVQPFTFKITGRTQEYINAFGEDLLLNHVQNALTKTNQEMPCIINDYTVAPYYINMEERGRMQFIIEFEHLPKDRSAYQNLLDKNLQHENSNYAQKRNNDIALSALELIVVPPGTFYRWLAHKGKLGGQHKVPRLVNSRKVADEILALVRGEPLP